MAQGADPTPIGKAPRGPEIRGGFLEDRMRAVLSAPRLRVLLPAEAIDLLIDLARVTDLNRASLCVQAAALEGLIAQRPQPPVGENRPLGRDD